MAITKTKFINYSRCPRYVALDDLKEEILTKDVTLEEYQKEEDEEKVKELLGIMLEETSNVVDEQLEVMLPYYNEIEILAGKLAPKYFNGTFKYAYNTQDQESFDCKINGIRYICYTDIYNEVDDHFNIIEVKATTSKKFLNINYGEDGYESIFYKKDGIYYPLEDLGINLKPKYYNCRNKLFDKLDPVGHYVYDLAVQRYIIENDLKQTNRSSQINKIKYYLAVLNADYVFDGKYEKGIPSYETNDGNDIVTYFDLTSITKDYMDIIDIDRDKVERYIRQLDSSRCPIGVYCENKRTTKCGYLKMCWDILPEKNSILTYLDNHHGFKDGDIKYNVYDLINEGMTSMLDVPDNYLNRKKNLIQKQVVKTHTPYFNKSKIIDGIKQITYPIYHLDFETFPCPLPRFKGEKPYTQSVFQFSLHIEKERGVCDKFKDHYGYLAKDQLDHREELIKELLKYIGQEGTVLVYNESFEKTRLKELADIFPQYRNDLLKVRDRIFDLMNIVKTKSKLYEELGYSKEEASLFNYYHEDMQGSFSIKKILPLFSNLSYKNMEIANGVQALVTYAKFKQMDKVEYEYKYQKLVEYCQQDTWAMFEILKGINESVK